jgi:hypothetical protein
MTKEKPAEDYHLDTRSYLIGRDDGIRYANRKWTGLTDKDMNDSRTHNFDFIDGARWAESLLKEKNHG